MNTNRRTFTALLLSVVLLLCISSYVVTAQELQTPHEASDFTETTTHEEMVSYLEEVNAKAADMTLHTYGTSLRGNELLYGIFSTSGIRSPAEAHATGKPVVVLSANVHGHNHVLREALLIMARELGTPDTELNALLDDVVVLIAPSKNPDGLKRNSRYNAVGADLNRDYMMLEQPSMAHFVGRIINDWHPHIMVDGHDGGAVQYGGAYPYHLLYQSSAIAGADPSITALADEAVFPYLDEKMEANGYRSFYWARGDDEQWYGGGSAPRMGRNYGGIANKMSILFEHADWPDAQTGVESGMVAFRSILEYARDHSDTLMQTIEAARQHTVELGKQAEGNVPVEETMRADDFRVTYTIGEPGEQLTVEDAEIIKKPVGTVHRDRPWAYVLPPIAHEAAAMLRRHNIQVEQVTETVIKPAVAYQMGGIDYEKSDNLHKAALLLEVETEIEEDFEIQEGAYLVKTGQLLGRVVTHLLEPETTDNVFYWNRMSPHIPIAEFKAYQEGTGSDEPPLLPIRKLMSEVDVPTITK